MIDSRPESEILRMKTSDEIALRDRYNADGFLLCPTIGLPDELAQRAARGLEAVRDGNFDTGLPPEGGSWKIGDPPARLVKIEQPQIASRALREVIAHESIGRIALEATGARWVQIWWVQGLIKPAAVKNSTTTSNVGWHQDRQYWKSWSKESELLTGWLALSDVTSASGPMIFARASHRWGLLDQGDFFAQDEAAVRAGICVPKGEKWDEVEAVLPRGGLSLHHHLTFHGSGANTSGAPRMSLALHMRTDESGPASGEPAPWVMKWTQDTSVCPIWHR